MIYNIKLAKKKAQIGDFCVLFHFYYQIFLAKKPKIDEKAHFTFFPLSIDDISWLLQKDIEGKDAALKS